MKNNKAIHLLSLILIIGIVLTGAVFAGVKFYQMFKDRINLVAIVDAPVYEDVTTIWVGSFQLAWNELKEYLGGNVTFNGEESDLVRALNNSSFSKDMLSEEDYYTKTAIATKVLREDVISELENKFGSSDKFELIRDLAFYEEQPNYFIYSVIEKEFEFFTKFDRLEKDSFKRSNVKYKYFGITDDTNDIADYNVDVLFYNDANDFAVKLNTKNNEDVFLYRTDNVASFNELYSEMKEKSNDFSGFKEFQPEDKLKIPYINLDTLISYDELCMKTIDGTDGMYISNAIQNVKFYLDEYGGGLTSESLGNFFCDEDPLKIREFYFTDKFVLFLKESDKEEFYMAVCVDDAEVLVK